jgi:hypothetical protein
MRSRKFIPAMSFYLFAIVLHVIPHNAYAIGPGCTAKIEAGTDKMIWGGEPLPYSTNIVFGAKNTERAMDGPELITRRGTQIPRKYLYDIASKCDAIREWDGDPYYFIKWYGN